MKRTFSYEEAASLIPEVHRRTSTAVAEVEALLSADTDAEVSPEMTDEYQRIVSSWAEAMINLGIEVKGLWLIDFDSGSGYYCWKHPEPSLQYFHGYDEGFTGRVNLN
jgi:hypothetical protein